MHNIIQQLTALAAGAVDDASRDGDMTELTEHLGPINLKVCDA